MNEESLNENQTSRKMEYKEDVQAIQQELLERKEQIIDGAPMLLLNISKAPYYLNVLFDQDGKPKAILEYLKDISKKFIMHLNILTINFLRARHTGEN